MEDLISYLRTHARSKPEDLACEVLAYLLRQEIGQLALRALFSQTYGTREVEVITQKQIQGCVPDILLVQNTKVVGILELKFGAGLSDHQRRGTYSSVCADTVFIVPHRRLLTVRAELREHFPHRTVSVLSWDTLLAKLAGLSSNDARDGKLFTGALDHLKEFCGVIEAERFAPFAVEELQSPTQSVRDQHLIWLVRQLIAKATEASLVAQTGRLTAGLDKYFYFGQNISIAGQRAWFGYWPLAWESRRSQGPMWLQFQGEVAKKLLSSGSFTDAVRITTEDIAFSLFAAPAPLQSQEAEVDTIFAALQHFALRLSIINDIASDLPTSSELL